MLELNLNAKFPLALRGTTGYESEITIKSGDCNICYAPLIENGVNRLLSKVEEFCLNPFHFYVSQGLVRPWQEELVDYISNHTVWSDCIQGQDILNKGFSHNVDLPTRLNIQAGQLCRFVFERSCSAKVIHVLLEEGWDFVDSVIVSHSVYYWNNQFLNYSLYGLQHSPFSDFKTKQEYNNLKNGLYVQRDLLKNTLDFSDIFSLWAGGTDDQTANFQIMRLPVGSVDTEWGVKSSSACSKEDFLRHASEWKEALDNA